MRRERAYRKPRRAGCVEKHLTPNKYIELLWLKMSSPASDHDDTVTAMYFMDCANAPNATGFNVIGDSVMRRASMRQRSSLSVDK